MGWDRVLGSFFLNIELTETRHNLYADTQDVALHLSGGVLRELDYVVGVLTSFGLSVPDVMLQEILKDKVANVGNRFVKPFD